MTDMDTLIAVAEEILVGDAATIARLSAEVEMLTRGGIIEVAIRNPSVADYMKHWEGRAEKAEAALQQAISERDEREAWAKAWHDDCDAAATILGLGIMDGGELPRAAQRLSTEYSNQLSDLSAQITRLTAALSEETEACAKVAADDELLCDEFHAELRKQGAFSIEHYGTVALAMSPFIDAAFRAIARSRKDKA